MSAVLRLVLVAALLAPVPAVAEERRPLLEHDPFSKPELAEAPEDLLADLVAEPAEPPALPELRGILRSPRATLVNLDGDLVPVGGTFERYVVVAVGERNAVLKHGDEQHVVSIDDPREKADDLTYR